VLLLLQLLVADAPAAVETGAYGLQALAKDEGLHGASTHAWKAVE
jgi:hypothetical protein